MITIPLFILTALYVVFGVWLCKKLKSWPARIAVALLMVSPAIYWVGTYQYVKYQHKAACARDGGLKVLIQPEKADRIRLDANSFSAESSAHDFLRSYSPRLAEVEAWNGTYKDLTQTRAQTKDYYAYSIDPAATALEKKDWKFNKFNKVLLGKPTPGLYVLSRTDKIESDVDTTTWKLERNGQLYATWTSFYHYWSRNGAMPIGWQCFQAGSPEALDKDANQILTELILK
ncbi:hypothetical protein [Polaromonas sp.]|uniref:hypothetical protein n=1 Tax=Polaromonas sp. TaxID=1869339 RepID=UPI002488723A|nr:hypothetical protein [Polaromonas sp.]MDI1338222.1 hypothetical protein [Polaromonas sp.]